VERKLRTDRRNRLLMPASSATNWLRKAGSSATITLDDSGRARGINRPDEYREMEERKGRDAAITYFRNIANTLNWVVTTFNGHLAYARKI